MNKKTKIGFIIGLVALVLIVGLVLLIVFLPSDSGENEFVPKEYNSIEATVDESGLRTVNVPVDEKGEAKVNLSGSLVDMAPADLTEIKIENSTGNYVFKCTTKSGEATEYTLVGFEDYDLNGTNASMLGTAISTLKMAGVVDVNGENKADYGLDNPKVTASAKFNDGSHITFYIGDNGPGETYTYVMVEGCDSVFSVLKTDAEVFFLDLNDMFNALIRTDYSTVSDEDFTFITLGGTHLAEEVTIEHAPDGSLNGYYVMTSHNSKPVNSDLGSKIVGSIKCLTADGVAFANPDADTLNTLGLDKPYATVEAHYEYTDAQGEEKELNVSMLCSEPDAEGNVYLMDEDGLLVYKIATDKISWAEATMEGLRSEYAFAPSYSAVKGMTLSNGSESYSFTVETVITEGVDDEGNETSVSEISVKYGDKEIEEGYFRTLFDSIALVPVRGAATADGKGEAIVTVTYDYNTGRDSDTVTYYATDSQKVLPEYEGEIDCYIYKADIDGIMDNAKALSEGKEITAIGG